MGMFVVASEDNSFLGKYGGFLIVTCTLLIAWSLMLRFLLNEDQKMDNLNRALVALATETNLTAESIFGVN